MARAAMGETPTAAIHHRPAVRHAAEPSGQETGALAPLAIKISADEAVGRKTKANGQAAAMGVPADRSTRRKADQVHLLRAGAARKPGSGTTKTTTPGAGVDAKDARHPAR